MNYGKSTTSNASMNNNTITNYKDTDLTSFKDNDQYTKELITAVTINNCIKKIQLNFRKFKQKMLINNSINIKKSSKKNFYVSNSNNPLAKSVSKSSNYQKTVESQYHEGSKVNLMGGRDVHYSKNYKNSNTTSGFGIQVWQDNAKYVGLYENDKANGYGIFYHCDGDIYKGEFKNDRADGYAIYKYFNGAVYEGYWKEDVQNGIGVERWLDNSFYEGDYSKGKKSGFGKYSWADGSYYEGEWLDNNTEGFGIYHFSDGRVYKGSWKNNMMNGFGQFIWGKEKVYCGKNTNINFIIITYLNNLLFTIYIYLFFFKIFTNLILSI
jgi:hypothetical protein